MDCTVWIAYLLLVNVADRFYYTLQYMSARRRTSTGFSCPSFPEITVLFVVHVHTSSYFELWYGCRAYCLLKSRVYYFFPVLPQLVVRSEGV